jgi:hypothetical protein
MPLTQVQTSMLGAGAVVQVVNFQTGALATGTGTIPADDTIPQNTEGNEFMTLAVTPTSSTNILQIDVVFFGATSSAGLSVILAALFQDSNVNAIACGMGLCATANGQVGIRFTHRMVAGTTSATTFRLRVGGNGAGTTTFNGSGGARYFGGTMASSITITEIKA